MSIVFCGSAASRVSARQRAYYAGPGNQFWPILAKTGLTPRRLSPHEYLSMPDYGLGLTDLCKKASGADMNLPSEADDPEGLRAKILEFQPRVLAFVGKRAAQVVLERVPRYGAQPERIGTAGLYVLPSPSGAARRYWDEKWWWELARTAREPDQ